MSTGYVDTKKAISVEELREMEANIEMNAIAVDYANNGASGASHSRCLRAKPEVRRSSWIDANERLPNETGRYWCYVKANTDTGISHEQDNCAFNVDEQQWYSESWKGGEKVTYWRDLMEPPIGGEL